ncbi:MAG: hypothetical protein ABIF10_03415 [Candidatus Woesearchaeota archaeon]
MVEKDKLSELRKLNIRLTAQALRESVKPDNLIIQAIDCIAEIEKAANILVKRLREWYELYNPELSRDIADNERFVKEIRENDGKKDGSIGAELSEKDIEQIRELGTKVNMLYELKNSNEKYIEELMQEHLPNTLAVAGSLVGAKLVSQAGSLKHLSEIPASTVQILGAEKALFRHMRTGAKMPKYGILHQHQIVQKAGKLQGKAARVLADKISIGAKVDYFHGEFIGDKLLAEVKRKLK